MANQGGMDRLCTGTHPQGQGNARGGRSDWDSVEKAPRKRTLNESGRYAEDHPRKGPIWWSSQGPSAPAQAPPPPRQDKSKELGHKLVPGGGGTCKLYVAGCLLSSRLIFPKNVGALKVVVLLVDLFTDWTFFGLSCVTYRFGGPFRSISTAYCPDSFLQGGM